MIRRMLLNSLGVFLEANRVDVFDRLIKEAIVLIDYDNVISICLRTHLCTMLETLLSASKNVKFPTLNQVLIQAIERSDSGLVELSIKKGANPNSDVVIKAMLDRKDMMFYGVDLKVLKALIRGNLNRDVVRIFLRKLSYTFYNLDEETLDMISGF